MVCCRSEANDLALQLSRYHTKAKEIIALERAYHGHVISLMSLSTYKMDQMQDGASMIPDFVHVVSQTSSLVKLAYMTAFFHVIVYQ